MVNFLDLFSLTHYATATALSRFSSMPSRVVKLIGVNLRLRNAHIHTYKHNGIIVQMVITRGGCVFMFYNIKHVTYASHYYIVLFFIYLNELTDFFYHLVT